jgi:hypothetical protein
MQVTCKQCHFIWHFYKGLGHPQILVFKEVWNLSPGGSEGQVD